jgi:hypothetical protein
MKREIAVLCARRGIPVDTNELNVGGDVQVPREEIGRE